MMSLDGLGGTTCCSRQLGEPLAEHAANIIHVGAVASLFPCGSRASGPKADILASLVWGQCIRATCIFLHKQNTVKGCGSTVNGNALQVHRPAFCMLARVALLNRTNRLETSAQALAGHSASDTVCCGATSRRTIAMPASASSRLNLSSAG